MNSVAIVGLSCRFPGADSPDAFWHLLQQGQDAVTRIPHDRQNPDLAGDSGASLNPAFSDQTNSFKADWGGFLSEIDQFDADFFGISPREAEQIDPQQRLLLEVTWEGLEQAAIAPSTLAGSNTGVFIGISHSDYRHALQQQGTPNPYSGTGTALCIAANRISYRLNLRGPSLAVDTACSSSLMAVHLACQSLKTGECGLAIAGGVNLRLSSTLTRVFQQAGMMAADGRCKTFDAQADGYVRSEGCGVVVLKRLADAERDCDRIFAAIRGSAVNQDGLSNGLTAPNGPAQQAVIRQALVQAGVAPHAVSYVEAHGTGTALGDPIEVNALKSVLMEGRSPQQPCAIGSVKTNIGHLEAAAGMASLIKVVLALQHRQIPPHLHLQQLNPRIDLSETPFFIPQQLQPWQLPAGENDYIAGISAFSFGGTNAHIIMSAAPELPVQLPKTLPGQSSTEVQAGSAWHLLMLSAKSKPALSALARRYAQFLQAQPDVSLDNLCFTAHTGRSAFPHRCAIVANSVTDLRSQLSLATQGQAGEQILQAKAARRQPAITFLCTGQGAQYVGMGRQLYQTQPTFRRILQNCDQFLRTEFDQPLLSLLYPETETEASAAQLNQTAYTQPALFALEYALAELWREWGVVPQQVIGHSLGEYVAACVAGALSWEDGLRLVTVRSHLMQSLPANGTMAVVFAAAETIQTAIDQVGSAVAIAVVNSSRNTVIAGVKAAVDQVLQVLAEQSIRSRALPVSHAFHSPLMEPILAKFEAVAASITYQTPHIPMISNVTGQPLTSPPDAAYWCQHLRQTVQFAAGVEYLATQTSLQNSQQNSLWVEIGPHSTLLGIVQRDYPAAVQPWLPSLERGEKDEAVILRSLGHLATQGIQVDWTAFHQHRSCQRIALPTYPFQRQRYWFQPMQPAQPIMPSSNHSSAHSSVPPVAPIQEKLQTLVAGLLKVSTEQVDTQAPFLEMGADSIVLIEAVQAIEANFGIKVTIRQFFEDLRTIEELAAFIAASTAQREVSPSVSSDTVPTTSDQAQLSSSKVQANSRSQSGSTETLSNPQSSQPVNPPLIQSIPTNRGATALERVVTQQLQVMAQQLAILQQADSALATAVTAPDTLPNALSNEASITAPAPKSSSVSPSIPQPTTVARPSPKSVSAETTAALTAQQQQHLQSLIQRYTQRTAGSKRRKEMSHPYLADSRACAGFRRSTKEMLYPIVGIRAAGSRLWDVDGNEYIDITMGFGVHLFGHAAPFIQSALEAQLQKGTQIGPQAELAGEVAQLIHELTGMERVTFAQSGTEAVMTALRLARTATGRTKIARFAQSYHGHFDGVLARSQSVGDGQQTVPLAPGIPSGMVEDVLVLEYGNLRSLQVLQDHAHELAAVLVEPVQSRRPDVQPRQFLHDLRQLTVDHGIALIFDEIITGFRIHPGGAQAWFGVEADIATYGKVLGGGMPIGVIAGKAQYMDGIDGGLWHYGDDSYPSAERTFFAGTFCKPPLALAAAKAVLLHLKQEGAQLQEQLNQRTTQLVQRLNSFFDQAEVPIRMVQFGSLFRFAFTGNYDLLFYHLIEKGIYIWEGRNCFLSTAHTEADVERIIQAVQASVAEMQAGGFLPGKSLTVVETLPLTPSQQEIWLLAHLQTAASLAYNESIWLDLRGKLEVSVLHRSLQQVVNRHEALRTAFLPSGEAQQIQPQVTVDLPVIDFTSDSSSASPSEQATRLQAWLQAEQQQPFDLTQAPLLRVQLLKLAEQHYGLVLTVHHIVVDGWSTQVLLEEMTAFYNAAVQERTVEESAIALPPPASYRAYIQRQCQTPAQDKAYWRDQFAQGLPRWRLPTESTADQQADYRGDQLQYELPTNLYQTIQTWSGQQGCTPFMTLLAGFNLLLHRCSKVSDLIVGISVAGQAQQDNPNLVGHCVNVLPLRSQIQPDQSLINYLHNLRTRLLDSYDHVNYSFSQLVRSLQIPRDPRTPILPVLFNLDPSLPVPSLHDLAVNVVPQPPVYVRWDLTWHLVEMDNTLQLNCLYGASLFEPATLQRWIAEYVALLRGMIQNPQVSIQDLDQQLDHLTKTQSRQLQVTLTQTNRQKLELIHRRAVQP
ncbi:MAG: aminotransferase class III-fold pyridoxal phosphate-dependent enzyme [Thainema sp.]